MKSLFQLYFNIFCWVKKCENSNEKFGKITKNCVGLKNSLKIKIYRRIQKKRLKTFWSLEYEKEQKKPHEKWMLEGWYILLLALF